MIKDLESAVTGSESVVFVNFHGMKVADETMLAIGQRDPVEPPLVVLHDLAVDPVLGALRRDVRLPRFESAPEDAHDLLGAAVDRREHLSLQLVPGHGSRC